MEGKPFKLRSGNKPAFKMMGAKTPAKHKVNGSYRGHSHEGMGLFERVTGKKFKDTTIGKGFYNEDGELKIKADIDQKVQDVKDLGTDVVKNQKPGTTKEERKNTPPEVTYTNLKSEAGDPYEYRKGSDGSYQYKDTRKEGDFITAEGKGLDAIKERYDSPADMKSPTKDYSVEKGSHGHPHSPAKLKKNSPAKVEHEGKAGNTGTMEKIGEQIKRKGKKKGITKKEANNPKYTDKVKDLRNKMKEIEANDPNATVENNRRLRILQNKINKEMDSDVRHRKNIFTGGKYKKVTKK